VTHARKGKSWEKKVNALHNAFFAGSASLNARMNGMIALRTMSYFLMTSLISALIGLVLVLAIHPGSVGLKEELGEGKQEERRIDLVDNFMDLGRNLFPDNLFKAAFQTAHTTYVEEKGSNGTEYERQVAYRSGTNTLGIIFFCLSFGTVLGSVGGKASVVIDFFVVVDEVIMKMVYGIMWWVLQLARIIKLSLLTKLSLKGSRLWVSAASSVPRSSPWPT